MKLKTIKLKNFRGYQQEISIPVHSNLTAFIGKNDIGKSTILEALEIFFNNKAPKIDNGDFHIAADGDEVEITCVFDHLPTAITIDADNSTTLADEYLLNPDGDLEIVKSYKKGATKPAESVSLKALHPGAKEYKGILEKTQSDLQAATKDLVVTDRRKNAELRKAIRDSIANLQLKTQMLSVKKSDAKSIWEKIETQLPLFALFKSDRASSDQDSEVQDPLKLAVDMALKSVQAQLEAIQQQVQDQAIDIANRTLGKMAEMNPELVKELTPQFKENPKWNGIFKLELNSDSGVPMNKRGSGMRRLVLLNFFRAEAERLKEERQVPEIIFALEEPETSQHPSNQEMIIEALKEIASSGKSQVLLTTHVPALAALLPLDGLRFIHKPEGSVQSLVEMPSEATYQKIAETLGVLPDIREVNTAKAFVLVEGHCDILFLRHAAKMLKSSGYLSHDLEDKQVVPLISGGCGNLKHWITYRLMVSLGKPYVVLLDSDKTCVTDVPGGAKNKGNIQDMQNQGVKILFTRKREIENYLCPSLLGDGVSVIGDFDDVKKMPHSNGGKVMERRWEKMTAEMILANDKYLDTAGCEKHEICEILGTVLALAD